MNGGVETRKIHRANIEIAWIEAFDGSRQSNNDKSTKQQMQKIWQSSQQSKRMTLDTSTQKPNFNLCYHNKKHGETSLYHPC